MWHDDGLADLSRVIPASHLESAGIGHMTPTGTKR